jgi:hypothetical protein
MKIKKFINDNLGVSFLRQVGLSLQVLARLIVKKYFHPLWAFHYYPSRKKIKLNPAD